MINLYSVNTTTAPSATDAEKLAAEIIIGVFTPWVTPFTSKKTQHLMPAWPETHSSSAVAILSAMAKSLRCMKEKGANSGVYMDVAFRFLKEKILLAPVQPSYIQVSFLFRESLLNLVTDTIPYTIGSLTLVRS